MSYTFLMFLLRWKRSIEKDIQEHANTAQLRYLSLFAIITIPLLTYRLSIKESPFHYTLSMIGNRFHHRIPFIARGVITGILLLIFILRLYSLKSFDNKRARNLLFLAIISLILTVLIPATDKLHLLKEIHLLAGCLFAICLMTSLYIFTVKLVHTNKHTHLISMILLYGTVGGSLIMLLIFGQSGIFEIFFFFMLTIFLVFLKYLTTTKS